MIYQKSNMCQLDFLFTIFFLFRENIAVCPVSEFLSNARTISSGDTFMLEFRVEVGDDFRFSFRMQTGQVLPFLLKSINDTNIAQFSNLKLAYFLEGMIVSAFCLQCLMGSKLPFFCKVLLWGKHWFSLVQSFV